MEKITRYARAGRLGSLIDDLDPTAALAAKILGERMGLLVGPATRRDLNEHVQLAAANRTAQLLVTACPLAAHAAAIVSSIHPVTKTALKRYVPDPAPVRLVAGTGVTGGGKLPLCDRRPSRLPLRALRDPVDEPAGDAAEDVVGRLSDPLGQVQGGFERRAAAFANARRIGSGFGWAVVGHFLAFLPGHSSPAVAAIARHSPLPLAL